MAVVNPYQWKSNHAHEPNLLGNNKLKSCFKLAVATRARWMRKNGNEKGKSGSGFSIDAEAFYKASLSIADSELQIITWNVEIITIFRQIVKNSWWLIFRQV